MNNKYEFVATGNSGTSCNMVFNCFACNACKNDLNFSNPTFSKCIESVLKSKDGPLINEIHLPDGRILIKSGIEDLKHAFSIKKTTQEITTKIENVQEENCCMFLETCFLKRFYITFKQENQAYFNDSIQDLAYYDELMNKLLSFLRNNKTCQGCLGVTSKGLMHLQSCYDGLFPSRPSIASNSGLENSRICYGNSLADLFHIKNDISRNQSNVVLEDVIKKIDYVIDEGGLIEVSIYAPENKIEFLYVITYHYPLDSSIINILKDDIEKIVEKDSLILKCKNFSDILSRIIDISKKKLLAENIDLKKEMMQSLALYISFSILGLDKLLPLLIDNEIEEIFLDTPDSLVYLHHARYHWCKTRVSLQSNDIERIIARLRFETNKNVGALNPTIKSVIKTPFFQARFNVDVDPLNPECFSLDIRRLNKKIFDIVELIKLNTINLDIAAFFVYCTHVRRNMTITGRTDSGKTTILNAIDMVYPEHLRKVYVEDEIETITQNRACNHQLKFQVKEKYEKALVIKELLHRSPDVVILGEILTQEESDAMFHCLAAGLKGLQTIHGNNIRSLVNRLVLTFKVDVTYLNELDYVILLNKYENGQRKVIEIGEIIFNDDDEYHINTLSRYDTKLKGWTPLDMYSSKKFNDYLERSNFNQDIFEEYMHEVKEAFSRQLDGNVQERTSLLDELNHIYIRFLHYF